MTRSHNKLPDAMQTIGVNVPLSTDHDGNEGKKCDKGFTWWTPLPCLPIDDVFRSQPTLLARMPRSVHYFVVLECSWLCFVPLPALLPASCSYFLTRRRRPVVPCTFHQARQAGSVDLEHASPSFLGKLAAMLCFVPVDATKTFRLVEFQSIVG